MEPCPRPECNGTLVAERYGAGTELTCRTCGRHPHSPQVKLPEPTLRFEYMAPWTPTIERRLKSQKLPGKSGPRFPGKRKQAKLKKAN